MKRLAVVVAAGLVAAAGCAPKPHEWGRLSPPVKAPAFMLTRLESGAVTLEQLHGKIILMEFWATWCGPCQYSSPSLDAMYRQYKDKGVTVLLVNEGEPAAKVRAWARGRFEAPIVLDSDLSVGRRYDVNALPSLFIIDGEGMVQYKRDGYEGGLEQDLRVVLKTLMDERDAAAKAHAR